MAEVLNIDNYDRHRGTAPLLRASSLWRSLLFLLVNLTGFVVVNAFWRFLSTGQWIEFGPQVFRDDLGRSIGRMLLEPLSILSYPWMIVVNGLLIGVVIFLPIMAAILYPMVWSALFVVVVAAFGHSPLLAVALAIGCFLAARTPLRSDMPFLALLLGMVPAVVFLYLFGLSVVSSYAVQPLQRGLVSAPFLIAVVSSVISGAIVLSLARLTGHRPGVIWPVLVALLAVPMTIFYAKVGTDELSYALIVNRLSPGGASISRAIPVADWKRQNSQEGLADQGLYNAIDGKLESLRLGLIEDCQRFLNEYGDSPRAASVLWIEAQCHSLQINEPALDDGFVMYSSSHPGMTSQKSWTRLANDYPAEAQAGLAHWRLAQLSLRRILAPLTTDSEISQLLQKSIDYLQRADSLLQAALIGIERRRKMQAVEHVFLPVRTVPAEGYYRQALYEVRRLEWLISSNEVMQVWRDAILTQDHGKRGEAKALVEALAWYLDLDPNRKDYRSRLESLISKYEGTNLGDNLMLAHANAAHDPYERANALIALARVRPLTDASIEACYELGVLASGTAAATAVALNPDLQKPQEYFDLVLKASDNPWKPLCKERLKWLGQETKQQE